MSNAEAIQRGMDAIKARGRITITGDKAKAKPFKTPEVQAEAEADAEAWGMLLHVRKLI